MPAANSAKSAGSGTGVPAWPPFDELGEMWPPDDVEVPRPCDIDQVAGAGDAAKTMIAKAVAS